MRFLPSWILELLQPFPLDSLFIPIAPPRAEGLLIYKRLGIKLFVNDPLESAAVLLRAQLENQGEYLSEKIREKCLQVPSKLSDSIANPFLPWKDSPFTEPQLNCLANWLLIAHQTSSSSQRELLYSVVNGVMAYWIAFASAKMAPVLSNERIFDYVLQRQAEQVFSGKEAIYALQMPFEELGDSVEASVYLIPLRIIESSSDEHSLESFFHGWITQKTDLKAIAEEIQLCRKGLIFDWKKPSNFETLALKAGKAKRVVICWSGDELPPRIHEEQIATPLKAAFSSRYPHSSLHMKTACRARDEFDFTLVIHE